MARRFRAPVSEGLRKVKVMLGTVFSTDKVKWTAVVQDQRGGRHEGVQIMPTYVNAGGGGSFHLPETGSSVWLAFNSEDAIPFIVGGASLPLAATTTVDEEGVEVAEGVEGTVVDGDPNDYRMNRPVINEGDHVVSSSDGNFVIVRKGGGIEIGASQVAQRLYFPLNNFIRDVCENYEMFSAGGKLEIKARRFDESQTAAPVDGEEVDEETEALAEAGGPVPVEFRLQLKEFAEEAPIIDVGLGRIAEEDGEVLPGQRNATDDPIVARVIINNRYRFWADRSGGVASYTHGAATHSVNGREARYNQAGFFHEVRGLFSAQYGDQNVTVKRMRTELVGANYSRTVRGDSIIKHEGTLTRTVDGPTVETLSSVLRVADSINEQVTNSKLETVGGSHRMDVGSDTTELIGGRKDVTVSGAGLNIIPALPDTKTYNVYIGTGAYGNHAALGKIKLSAGGPLGDFGLAKVILKPTGTIYIGAGPVPVFPGPFSISKVEVNLSGVSIGTIIGGMTVDLAGQVGLGPIGPKGRVVTTLTHPFDYITGIPIFGSSHVSAGGLPLPGPAIPVLFVPDPS
jgi:hypothetical protein